MGRMKISEGLLGIPIGKTHQTKELLNRPSHGGIWDMFKEHICITCRHRQECGDGQREGGPGIDGGRQSAGYGDICNCVNNKNKRKKSRAKKKKKPSKEASCRFKGKSRDNVFEDKVRETARV